MSGKPSPNDAAAAAIRVITDGRLIVSMYACANSVFIYDLFLTAPSEYRFVWKAKWSLGKVLYILVRHPYNFVLLFLTVWLYSSPMRSPQVLYICKALFSWQTFGGWMQFTVGQVILGLRTIALYNMRTWVVVLVAVLGIISSLTILIIDIRFLVQTVLTTPPERGCYRTCTKCINVRGYMFLPLMIFDAVVFALTLYKHNEQAKLEARGKTPLLRVLYRDGFIYFAVIFTFAFVNFLIYSTSRGTTTGLLTPLFRTLVGIMCGRLLLNLRGVLMRRQSDQNSTMVSPSIPLNNMQTAISTGLGVWNTPKSLSISQDLAYGSETVVTEYLDP